MPPSAQYALTAAIIASAAGALMMCLLVFKYGFAPPGDELPESSTRRLFVTRLGHAGAAACFAVTAILAAVTLAQLARVPRPAPVSVPQPERSADRDAAAAQLAALASRISAAESRLTRTDERVQDVEVGLRKVGEDFSQSLTRVRQPERATVAPRRQSAVAPEHPAPVPVVARPVPAFPSGVSAMRPTPVDKPAPPAPQSAAAVVTSPPPPAAALAPPPAPVPAAPPASVAAAPPARVLAPPPPAPLPLPPAIDPARASGAPMPTAHVAPHAVRARAAEAPPAAVRKSPPPPEDLSAKVKHDWDTVKRSFSTAGDEIRSAVTDITRKVRGSD